MFSDSFSPMPGNNANSSAFAVLILIYNFFTSIFSDTFSFCCSVPFSISFCCIFCSKKKGLYSIITFSSFFGIIIFCPSNTFQSNETVSENSVNPPAFKFDYQGI